MLLDKNIFHGRCKKLAIKINNLKIRTKISSLLKSIVITRAEKKKKENNFLDWSTVKKYMVVNLSRTL
jgi:hypothetical protein